MTGLHLLDARLAEDVSEGLFTRGAQVCISLRDGRRYERAVGEDGLGRPVVPETIFRVYCTGKPLTAAAVGKLVDDGRLDLDEPLEALLPQLRALRGGVTLRHVMTHTAGLHRVSGLAVEMIPAAARDAYLASQGRPPGWRVGADAGYAELLGWHVLALAIEAVTGSPAGEHVRDAVLRPLGMHDTYFGMTRCEFDDVLDRLGVNLDLRGWRALPMLFERTERVCCETNLAHGAYTTAPDLDRFYAACLDVLSGTPRAGLPSLETLAELVTTQRAPARDEVLDRVCSFGLGFMTELEGHRFGGEVSPAAFGHSGNVGSSFAFADPVHGVAVSVVFNGIIDHESAFVRRPALVRAIYRDLELSGPREARQLVRAPRRRRFRHPSGMAR